MSRVRVVAALLLASGIVSGQSTGVLRVSLTLSDASQATVPIANHALLISENPPTRVPRRVVTAADGTVAVQLTPGSYLVESDRPVAFLGKGYQWVAIVDVVAGQDTRLSFTTQNADVVALTATAPDTPASERGVSSEFATWQTSVVTIWSPTAQTSGFVVDSRGLVATDRNGVGAASSVELQLSATVKVPARVLVAEPAQDVAIVWVDPTVLGSVPPVPLGCPVTSSLDTGSEVVAITASPRGTGDLVRGEITGFHPRGMETDLRLSFGESGGPVFAGNPATLVGLTSLRTDEDARRGDVRVVRAGIVCETLVAARAKMSGATPPEPTPLPLEPTDFDASQAPAQTASGPTTPPVVSSANFELALVTPTAVARARERADWTGGRSGRAPEAEARLGRLTDFGAWTEYFAAAPPVLVVRVTPKLVEGFWMRLAREAARTQGAALPAFKDFKTNFLRLSASCGGREVRPIHPFALEHAIGDKRILREGLYVFASDAFGPHCPDVTFTIVSEQEPEKGEVLKVDAKLIEQVWSDFAPRRTKGR
jgi:S1-C subfamily serine protease